MRRSDDCVGQWTGLVSTLERELPALRRYVRRRLQKSEVDDVLAEVVYAALCARSKSDGALTRAWLYAVARNKIVDHWRGFERRSAEALDAVEHVRSFPAPLFDDCATRLDVQKALARLPERQRRALEVRYLEADSVNEVAERLGVSYRAAESLLARARASFRNVYFPPPGDRPGSIAMVGGL